MRITTIFLIIFCSINLKSQESFHSIDYHHGFIFGVSVGAGSLFLKQPDNQKDFTFSISLPNIKFGYFLNKQFALQLLLPGAVYKYNKKDRGFEGAIFCAQYWMQPNWWLLIGGGFTFDAPAFYTVKDPRSSSFYTGFPALTLATGWEVYHYTNKNIDLQFRTFYGQSNTNNGLRTGWANMLLLGFNWN